MTNTTTTLTRPFTIEWNVRTPSDASRTKLRVLAVVQQSGMKVLDDEVPEEEQIMDHGVTVEAEDTYEGWVAVDELGRRIAADIDRFVIMGKLEAAA
jgi:hypothetical protein